MSIHRPITPARSAPRRFVAEAALRAPAHGGLGWLARLEIIAVASLLLWGLILILIALIV